MLKKACYVAVFALSGVALLFTQTNMTVRADTSWHSGDTAPHHEFDYDKRVPPALPMPDAYILAINKLGNDTNQFYCVGSACLGSFPIASNYGSHPIQGWEFEFSSTNGIQKKVLIGFDKSAYME